MKKSTIGKIAEEAGVGVETIRFYERKGLIQQPPKPAVGGYRVYPPETVQRIRFIRQGQELGFSLREIEELLSLKTHPATDCADVRRRAQTKLNELNLKISRMKKIQSALKQLVKACPGQGELQLCSIMEAMEGSEKKPGKKVK